MISHTGKVLVRVKRLMDEFHRREDGSESILLADSRFDNHNKMTITGVVETGTDTADPNPLTDADMIMPRAKIAPLGYVTNAVFGIDIRAKDEVWYHYLCSEDKTMMNRSEDGSWLISMQASDIFCLRRDGKLIMNSNWVLGKAIETPVTLVDQHGILIRAELKPSTGIMIVKGLEIAPMVDEAIVIQIDPVKYRNVCGEVHEGERVYLSKDSCFDNVILGSKKLLFRHWDIIARYHEEPREVIPVGPMHLIEVTEEFRYSVIKGIKTVKPPEWGTIISSGAGTLNGKPGDKIFFSRRFTRMLTKTIWLIHDGEIQFKVV